jgi:hypothetical protein
MDHGMITRQMARTLQKAYPHLWITWEEDPYTRKGEIKIRNRACLVIKENEIITNGNQKQGIDFAHPDSIEQMEQAIINTMNMTVQPLQLDGE